MKILQGKTANNPIRIKRSKLDKNVMSMRYETFDRSQSEEGLPAPTYASADSCIGFLDLLFGGSDYNYFIKHQSTMKKENGTYQTYYVEDVDGESHSIFFLIED